MAGDDFNPIEYGASFISGKWPENTVRFWVESRLRVIDARQNKIEDYYQCASCKSEYTFVEKDLFKEDNYDFLPVFGPEYGIIYRRKAYHTSDYKSCQLVVQMWEGQNYKLKEPKSFIVLESNEAIRKATNEGLPLVAHTEMANEETGLKAIIEYPVKTMNIHDARNLYQVDTGPILLPDISKRFDRTVDSIRLAYVAFNVQGCADFVIETVTSIHEKGSKDILVYHYSQILSLPVKNTLFALSDE